MKKISTIIIDDEHLGRELIKEFLQKRNDMEIIAECHNAYEAYQVICAQKPDLIFLDIQMPEVNGFELLEMLDKIPQVIFCTAYDQYAIKAFEVNAVDYLLKPFDEQRFNKALDRAIQNFASPAKSQVQLEQLVNSFQSKQDFLERLLIKQAGKIVIISCHEISWIEAMDDYVQIHTSKESYLIQQSMNMLESRLDPNQFIRVHRSYIVNIDAVKEILNISQGKHKVILKDSTEVSLSRTGSQKLKRFCL